MSKAQTLRAFVQQRLSAAAEEIFERFERIIAENEEELCGQRKLPGTKPEVRLHRAEVPPQLVSREDVPPEQQERSPRLPVLHTYEKRFICSVCEKTFRSKEDIVKHMTLHTGEKQYSRSVCVSVFTGPFQLKNHQCVGRQSLQLHQSQTEQMDTQADGEDCGGPEGHLQPDTHDKTSHFSEPETDLEEIREPQSGSNTQKNNELPGSDQECNTGKTSSSSSECATSSGHKGLLQKRNYSLTGDGPFNCSVCSKNFSHRESLTQHMSLHVGERGYICSVCGRTLTSWPQFVNHKCAGHRFPRLHQRLTKQNKTEAYGEDSGGPEPAKNPDPDRLLQPATNDKTSHFSEPETNLKETREPQSGSNPQRDQECNTGKTASSSSECATSSGHKETQTGGKSFSWSACSTKPGKESLTLPTGEKQSSCSVCGKSFTWSELKYHQCAGRQSSQQSRDEELVKTEPDGEDCGGPEPARNTDPEGHFQPDTDDKTSHTEPETDKTSDLKETKEPQSGSNTLQINEVPGGDQECSTVITLTSECATSSGHKGHLQDHNYSLTEDGPFSCSFCSKNFSQRESLTQHMSLHVGETRYWCSVCGESFIWSKLKHHQCAGRQSSHLHQSQTEENRDAENLKTDAVGVDCGGPEPARNSDTEGHLQPATDDKTSHFSEPETDLEETKEPQSGSNPVQNNEVPGSDQECNNVITLSSSSECATSSGHKETQTVEKPFSWSVFSTNFAQRQSLTLPAGDKQYSCSDCGRNYTWWSQLKNHQCAGRQASQLHQSQIEEKRDEELVKTDADGEDCGGPEPARTSDPDRDLQLNGDYKTENSSDTETDDNCDWAETREPQSGPLQNNEVPVHDVECNTGKTSRSSSECATSSGHKGRLQEHNGLQREEKPFSCSVCGKRYTLKGSLTRHMRLHSEGKGFSCSVCKNTFLRREDVVKHMKIHTRKKKQYSCSVCGKTFTRPSQLKTHQCAGRQSSQLHQSQIEEKRDGELVKTEADGEDCGGPEPARNSDPDRPSHPADDKTLPSSELCASQEGEKSPGLEEADIIKFTFSPVSVKSEEDDEEKPQPSQLHQRLTEQMETETDGEDCGGPGPAKNSDLGRDLQRDTHDKKSHSSELRTSQVEEQLQGVKDADITRFTFTPVRVKSEEDDEEKPQPSQLHQRLTEQMKTQADGEDCGGPGPVRNSDPERHLQPDTDDKTDNSSDPETDDNCDWEETRDSNPLQNNEVPVGDVECNTGKTSRSSSECATSSGHKGRLQKHNGLQREEKPFSCSVCGKRYTLKGSLTRHMRLHSEGKGFSCSVCKNTFLRREDVVKHMKIHTRKKKQYSCSVCGKTFTRRPKFKKHQCAGRQSSQLHQGQTEEAGGEDCGGPEPATNSDPATDEKTSHFSEPKTDLEETREPQSGSNPLHNKTEGNTGEKPYSCAECGKLFRKKSKMKRHMKIHTGHKPFSCSVCSKGFNQRKHLKEHKATHKKDHSCSVCGKTFTRRSKFKKHQCAGRQASQLLQIQTEENRDEEHLKTEADGEDCGGPEPATNSDPATDDKTSHFSELKTGLEETGDQGSQTEENRDEEHFKPEAEGEDCGGPEPARNSDTDLQPATDDKTSHFFEPETGLEETREPQSGSNPLQNNEVSERDQECSTVTTSSSSSECATSSGHKGHQQKLNKIQEEEMPFSCSVCGKGYLGKNSLTRHMRIHPEGKQFSCSVCEKTFYSRSSLSTHKRNDHAPEMPFSCSICGRGFEHKQQLSRHMNAGLHLTVIS